MSSATREAPTPYLTNLALTHEPIMELSEMIGGYHSFLPAEKLAYQRLVRPMGRTGIMQTPQEVTGRGHVLTNPSKAARVFLGEHVENLAYFRDEPVDDHLGKTCARPYFVRPDGTGGFKLAEADFHDAIEVPGEDPRMMPNIALKGLLGKIHRGVCVSTVVATRRPGGAFGGADIEHVFWWGENFGRLEPVAVVRNHKNAGVEPVDPESFEVHTIGRPHPHVTYKRLEGDLTKLNEETLFDGATVLTKKLVIPGVHFGGNGIELIRGGDKPQLALDLHTGYTRMLSDDTKELHYWQSDWIIEPAEQTMARCVGTFATRAHFRQAEPKPPNGVIYDDVIYGGRGQQGRQRGGLSLFGISDRHIGYGVMA